MGAPIYQCPRCSRRKKNWAGSDPVCGFTEQGLFVFQNWNCATLLALRRLETARGVSIPASDDTMLVIPVDRVDFSSDESCPLYLQIFWYKSRGKVCKASIIYADYEARDVTLEQAEEILRHFEKDGI